MPETVAKAPMFSVLAAKDEKFVTKLPTKLIPTFVYFCVNK